MNFPAVVDYSYGRPSPSSIANSGYVGALRYLGHDGRCLTRGEADGLLAAGLGIGLIYEEAASACLGGWNTGVQHANNANRYADEVGAPDVPIFYAVDFQPTPDQLYGPIVEYFRGAMSVGGRPVLAYGCAMVMQCLCGDVVFPDSWQCAAWSYPGTAPGTPINDGGWNLVLSPYASILQCIGYVLGDTSDHNNLITADRSFMWGLEGTGDEMTDDDWNHMASMLSATMVSKLAMHNSQGNLIEDAMMASTKTIAGDGTIRRCHPNSAYEANASRWWASWPPEAPESSSTCPRCSTPELPTSLGMPSAIPWAGD
jgi:hypothetical protein